MKVFQLTNLRTKTDALKIRRIRYVQTILANSEKKQFIDLEQHLEKFANTLDLIVVEMIRFLSIVLSI